MTIGVRDLKITFLGLEKCMMLDNWMVSCQNTTFLPKLLFSKIFHLQWATPGDYKLTLFTVDYSTLCIPLTYTYIYQFLN